MALLLGAPVLNDIHNKLIKVFSQSFATEGDRLNSKRTKVILFPVFILPLQFIMTLLGSLYVRFSAKIKFGRILFSLRFY